MKHEITLFYVFRETVIKCFSLISVFSCMLLNIYSVSSFSRWQASSPDTMSIKRSSAC